MGTVAHTVNSKNKNTMKNYYVLRAFKMFTPAVIEGFDELADAEQFCKLLNKTTNQTHFVVTTNR